MLSYFFWTFSSAFSSLWPFFVRFLRGPFPFSLLPVSDDSQHFCNCHNVVFFSWPGPFYFVLPDQVNLLIHNFRQELSIFIIVLHTGLVILQRLYNAPEMEINLDLKVNQPDVRADI